MMPRVSRIDIYSTATGAYRSRSYLWTLTFSPSKSGWSHSTCGVRPFSLSHGAPCLLLLGRSFSDRIAMIERVLP